MSQALPQRRIGAAPIVAIVLGVVVVAALFLALLGMFFVGVPAKSPTFTSSPAPAAVRASEEPKEVSNESAGESAEPESAPTDR